jgi:hypothetical protein
MTKKPTWRGTCITETQKHKEKNLIHNNHIMQTSFWNDYTVSSPLTCVYKNQARIINIKKKKEKDFTIRIES